MHVEFRIFHIWHTITEKGLVITMEKFRPTKEEKDIISMRISKELLKEVDLLATQNDLSRNEFIVQSIQFAIKNMDCD